MSYDQNIGRFIERDPMGFAAGDPDLYRYVGNSPINGVDPSGMQEGQQQPTYPQSEAQVPNSTPEQTANPDYQANQIQIWSNIIDDLVTEYRIKSADVSNAQVVYGAAKAEAGKSGFSLEAGLEQRIDNLARIKDYTAQGRIVYSFGRDDRRQALAQARVDLANAQHHLRTVREELAVARKMKQAWLNVQLRYRNKGQNVMPTRPNLVPN